MHDDSDIRHIISRLGRSIEGRDFDAAAALFAEDAVLMLPGQPMFGGSAAIRGALSTLFAPGSPAVEVVVSRVETARSGDLAFAYGTGLTHAPGPLRSKWLAVFRKLNGDWKIVVDTFNADAATVNSQERP